MWWKVSLVNDILLIIAGFFGENASLERKFRGFQIFSMLLPEIHANFVPKLLTPNLLRCIVNHSYNVDRYLHKASKKAVCVQSH